MQIRDVTNLVGITQAKQGEALPPTGAKYDFTEERRMLMSWKALSRKPILDITKKMSRSLIIIGVVVGLILISMQEFFLVFVGLSAIFMLYVLSNTAPEEISFELSNHGINYAGKIYLWNELKQFFYLKNDSYVAAIDVIEGLPARLFVSFAAEDKEKIHAILNKYLPFLEEQPENLIDKTFNGIFNKIQLEGVDIKQTPSKTVKSQ